MNNILQVHQLEADLERLCVQIPDAPLTVMLLSRLLLELGRGMASILERRIRPFGLGDPQFQVLSLLFAEGECGAHPGELGARTSQSAANMSRISDALVGCDFITRESRVHDRRKIVLRITGQGEELVRRLLPTLFGSLSEIFKDLSVDEEQQLITQLKRLSSKLQAPMPMPPVS